MSKIKSFRISDEDLKLLEDKKINLNKLLKDAINKALKEKKCPTCGQKIK